jgi:hypothetical protein
VSTWRDIAAPIVADVIKETAGKPEREVRAALREAYPFGERKYWPYKVWCDEVRYQLGIKQRADGEKRYQERLNEGQLAFFEEDIC